MKKARRYEIRQCFILKQPVKLSIDFMIIQPSGEQLPGGVIYCDHIGKCGVKIPSKSGYDFKWENCPFHDKQFK